MISDADLRELADKFAVLGRGFVGPDALTAVTRAAVTLIPGTQYASISQGRGGQFTTVAPTDHAATRADAIQYALGAGPCVDAILEDRVYCTGDLPGDVRWPDFGPRAFAATGARSMLSFRMFFENDDGLLAGLNLYSNDADAFDAADVSMGTLLATHGALAIAAFTSRQRSDNLNQALMSNREIGVAMGVIMTSHKLTREQSFNLLRIASQNYNRKHIDIATDVADTGILTLPPPKPTAPDRGAPARRSPARPPQSDPEPQAVPSVST